MVSDVENDSTDERIEECKIVDSDGLVSKIKTKGFVWKYFRFELDSNGCIHCVNLPKCCLNQGTVAAKDPNTSNLYT